MILWLDRAYYMYDSIIANTPVVVRVAKTRMVSAVLTAASISPFAGLVQRILLEI